MKRQVVIVENGHDHPSWVEDVIHKISKCWKSPGGLTLMVNRCEEGHWHLVCCPSIRELVGGKNDGKEVHPRFQLNIGRFMRIFDFSQSKVIFDSASSDFRPYIMFTGKINSEQVEIAVVSTPIPGQPITELMHRQGPKKGLVEPRQQGEGFISVFRR